MSKIGVIIIIFLPFLVFAQKRINITEITHDFFLPPSFIKTHNIIKISGEFSQKKRNDIIRESNAKRIYYFNDSGFLQKAEEIKNKDTTFYFFEYDRSNNLVQSVKKNRHSKLMLNYSYDSLDRITKEQMTQAYYSMKDPTYESTVTEEKQFSYQAFLNDRQLKRFTHNSEGSTYREEILYLDSNDRIFKENSRLLRTSGIKTTHYYYNSKSLIDSVIIVSNQFERETVKMVNEYDDKNRILARHFFRNKEHTAEQQIIYNQDNGNINYILERDPLNDFISILKLEAY